jgi:hypothetical protein
MISGLLVVGFVEYKFAVRKFGFSWVYYEDDVIYTAQHLYKNKLEMSQKT